MPAKRMDPVTEQRRRRLWQSIAVTILVMVALVLVYRALTMG